MAFAFALLVSKKLKLVSDSDKSTLYSRGITWLISVLAVAGLAVSKDGQIDLTVEHLKKRRWNILLKSLCLLQFWKYS